MVVRAGRPTREEIAAVIAAVEGAGDGHAGDGLPRPAGPPPWQRAARLEATGAGRLTAPADVELAASPRPGWP